MDSIATTLDRTRIKELTLREEEKLNARTQKSKETFERARHHLSGGVASSYQLRDPWPIYMENGTGPVVWDVDGNEMYDFHNGFGSMVQGHANPLIGEAVSARYTKGTHFAAPTEDSIAVGDNLAARWGLPKWRYTNSGSESTMDAIRIARGFTGRDPVMKIFGSYHGHHDTVMVSIGVEYDQIGDHEHLASLPYGAGIPQSTVDQVVAVPFNDAGVMERRMIEMKNEGRLPACVIMEAAMMNLGVVLPEEGYLEEVRRITAEHGVVLIFDEVKTGITIAPGGAVEKYGVMPDMVTLAKALGGGFPVGAIGGSEEVMSVVEDGSVYQVGTYNGNPLCMAAARANLEQVMVPDAYATLDHLNDRILSGCDEVIAKHNLPGYTVGIGSKGCVTFS
ncbi:MAG: aminotransferase class III-fold pyridoxal phosphate-dependent enzyme, partial [Actinomycetota bacterium]|nr:aminotransferase class III-fold pyridoxal phosphate-dependent enzyme [Actinomycetota bacterium]